MAPNNSFKPTPHRGSSNSVHCATLARCPLPRYGAGLTQALGGHDRSFLQNSRSEELRSTGFGSCFFARKDVTQSADEPRSSKSARAYADLTSSHDLLRSTGSAWEWSAKYIS